MVTVAEREAKAERIELRVTPHAKALLVAAAQARHTSVSEFLLAQGIAAAEQTIAMPRVFYASGAGWGALQQMLDDDEGQQPSAATIDWFKSPTRS